MDEEEKIHVKKAKKGFISSFCSCLFKDTLVPLIIIVLSVNLVVVLPYVIVSKNSNLSKSFRNPDVALETITEAWANIKWLDLECWSVILGFIVWGIATLHFPGHKYYGPPAPNGFRPEYWHSGVHFYLTSAMFSLPCIWYFPMLHWYYKIPNLCALLAVFGIVACMALYFKGLFAPCPGICEISRNPIYDYYWGVELYPHIGPFVSLKILIICRFSLYLWQLIVWIAWKVNFELYIASYRRGEINFPLTASTILQTIYLAKFYWWEDGYMQTIDIAVEKFGFYIAWGCIAFVPAFYTLTSLYLVKHSPIDHFGVLTFTAVLGFGLLMIGLNYWTDYQRQVVRATNGKCNIWGKPAKVVRAEYLDDNEHTKRSVLLASGFWAMGRRMNYTYELMSAFLWSVPALFASPVPYFYLIYLTGLLIHRTERDEARCAKKYGKFWTEYKRLVPYKMIPGIY